jgi:hypothetical protein
MEVSGELHAQAVLPPRSEALLPTVLTAEWAPGPVVFVILSTSYIQLVLYFENLPRMGSVSDTFSMSSFLSRSIQMHIAFRLINFISSSVILVLSFVILPSFQSHVNMSVNVVLYCTC